MAKKKVPKPAAASRPNRMLDSERADVLVVPLDRYEVMTTPATASARPMSWIRPGISPAASPARRGITGAVAATGATILMVPTARPR